MAYRHSFWAPPMHRVPGIYWGVLVRAKMRAELRLPGPQPRDIDDLSTEELRRRLESAVEELGCHNHPLLDDIRDESGNRAMTLFAKNWYGSCQGFAAQLVQLVQRTSGDVRREVAENVADEFAGVTHDELRMRFIESVGFHYEADAATTDPDRVYESYALMSYRTALCVINDPLYALGSFYTTEANWPLECKRMLKVLRKRGATEHDIEYWTTHAVADEHHSAGWLDALLRVARTGAERKRALIGAVAQLHLRRRMYDSMRALAHAGAPGARR